MLDQVIEQAGLLQQERRLGRSLALVLVYELLISGKGGLQCGGALRKTMKRHQSRLHSELMRMKVRAKVKEVRALLPLELQDDRPFPVYARVNQLRTDMAQARAALQAAGFTEVDAVPADGVLQARQFAMDPHVPQLLVFAPSTDFHQMPLYLSGALVLQDKASCFPAAALAPEPGEVVIDACCAPGNKTSHMAALMRNTGTIHAFDIDARRLSTMAKLHQRAGVTCTAVHNSSFLDAEPAAFPTVSKLLLDPSVLPPPLPFFSFFSPFFFFSGNNQKEESKKK